MADALGLRTVDEHDVVLVDVRDLDPAEAEFLATSAIRVVPLDAIPVPDGPIYLHLDVDVTDPELVPGLMFPAPDGPQLGAVGKAVAELVATGRVVAVALACTWRPGSGGSTAVAETLTEHLGPLL